MKDNSEKKETDKNWDISKPKKELPRDIAALESKRVLVKGNSQESGI
jgi:hypothetical protein